MSRDQLNPIYTMILTVVCVAFMLIGAAQNSVSLTLLPIAALFIGYIYIILHSPNRTGATVMTLGIFTGLGGASHGPGEILQGNYPPTGIYIKAWPGLTILNGEPAVTIIQSLLVSGVLTIIVGIIVAVWASYYVHRRHGGVILALLSLLLLLVGGGQIPPLFGIAAGFLARRVNGVPSRG